MSREGLLFIHGKFQPQNAVHIDKRYTGFYSLVFMADGGVELAYDERRYTLVGKWFWLGYPGPRVQFRPAAGYSFWAHRYVIFGGPLATRWEAEGLLPKQPQRAPGDRDYGAMIDELHAQANRGTQWGSLRATNLLERLLLELAEARAQGSLPESWLERVMKQISSEHNFVPDYQQLAADCSMGLSTLRRRFKQATGTTLHAYVLRSRMAAARTLLGGTSLSIKEIADRVGYSDVYFFSRQFRALTGMPPTTYRKSCLP